MSTPSVPSAGLVPAGQNPPSFLPSQLPEILRRAGKAAVFAAEEFFFGRIRNEHTRAAYLIAVRRFLQWAEDRGLELVRIAPGDVGQYLDWLRKENTSVATRKQHLAAIRHFFDGLVTRHAILLNPALSVRGTTLEQVLDEWLNASSLAGEPAAPLFPTMPHRKLSGRIPLPEANVHMMIQ